ncbi:MAG: alkaline phosphatase family protein [Candidatus Methylomirabilales bacterium]
MARRVVLLGLDGATFDVLGPWAREGLLPHFARMMREGVWGDLTSTVPPTTPPAWATIVTGVNPGKHGIYDFRESPSLDPARPLISSRSLKAPTLWHLLNRHGKKVGVFNVPITFPPQPVDGFVISGMMTPGEHSSFAFPASLKAELLRAVPGYIVDVDIPQFDVELKEDAMAFLTLIGTAFERRRQAMFYLLERWPWDFFMAVFVLTDRVQHLFWKYLDPTSALYASELGVQVRARVVELYQRLDAMFGALLDRLDGQTDLFVISDHGFGPTKAFINVNCWLEDLGLLRLRRMEGLKRGLLYRAMVLNEAPWVKRLVPLAVQGAIRRRVRKTRSTFKTDVEISVDWSRTKAFFPSIPSQGIYICAERDGQGAVTPDRKYEEVRELIRQQLYELRDPTTRQKVVDRVWFREEVYEGPLTRYAPDVLFVAQDYSYLGRGLFRATEWIRSSEAVPNGFHRMNGVFFALGPAFKAGQRISGAGVTDITPTILEAMGISVSAKFDGRVLSEIWR